MSTRASLQAIIRQLRPRPHAAIITRALGPGTLLIRFFGPLTEPQRVRVASGLEEHIHVGVYLKIECVEPTVDLDALAVATVARDSEEAPQVLHDALLAMGILHESATLDDALAWARGVLGVPSAEWSVRDASGRVVGVVAPSFDIPLPNLPPMPDVPLPTLPRLDASIAPDFVDEDP